MIKEVIKEKDDGEKILNIGTEEEEESEENKEKGYEKDQR